ncbi:hypothetical protein SSX86_000662 [Deinandra increscens subsp. villosa]|uniref:Uncharacterized protein n=1 Tax=Deinandra increscens subsp. villosa TaxID=3103831 RepID=A0AAP0DTK9_9ASTR
MTPPTGDINPLPDYSHLKGFYRQWQGRGRIINSLPELYSKIFELSRRVDDQGDNDEERMDNLESNGLISPEGSVMNAWISLGRLSSSNIGITGGAGSGAGGGMFTGSSSDSDDSSSSSSGSGGTYDRSVTGIVSGGPPASSLEEI